MQICIICTSETNFSTKCGCHFCLECLINWFEEKNRDKAIKIIQCPNQDCPFSYSRDEILSYCSLQPYERMIQEILVKEYLKNEDVRPCPNGKCKYYGYIELQNKCDDELECQECGMKWRDFALASYTYQIEYMIQNIFGIIREFCYCFITANECPNCGVLIQRNGGCKHMTCKVCAHQFCWLCKQQWGRHKETQCFSQFVLSIGLLLTFPVNILYQFGVFYYLLYLLYPLLWIFELFTMNVLIIGTLSGLFGVCKSIYDLQNRRRFYENLLILGGCIILLTLEYFILQFSTNYLDITLGKSIIGFGLEILIIILVFSYFTRIGFRWILIPIIGILLCYQWGLNGLSLLIWQFPVIFGSRNLMSQIYFNFIAIGLLVLFNIFSLQEIFVQTKFYLLLGSTLFQFKRNAEKNHLVFVGILAISYIYDIIFS
ncbi:unnamed protein product [Paramecium sonneborni]|uniref:RING-type domain-containing protein n=1 Tax=Paramecium sonneborni TaxID=65129 RepID=A0A8S1RFB1_9CILI|nr:unnamed protein product [Paramecium sonneborni]